MVVANTPRTLRVAAALSLLVFALLVVSVPAKADNDGIPDQLESEMCGRAAIHDLINTPEVPGQCVSSTDYDPSEIVGLPGTVEGIVSNQTGFLNVTVHNTERIVDHDGDLVPDALEPFLCQVENSNDPSDGYCVGDDYSFQDCYTAEDKPVSYVCHRDGGYLGFGTAVDVLGVNIWL